MRLIDADALLAKGFPTVYHTEFCTPVIDVADIERMPTIDAAPLVHGYWIIKPHGTYGQLRAFCSACGKHSGIGGIISNQKKPYCPNCGAKMDGKRKDIELPIKQMYYRGEIIADELQADGTLIIRTDTIEELNRREDGME